MALGRAVKVTKTQAANPLSSMDLTRRRALGRFDTPRPLSQVLVDWAVRKPTDEILEPSAGGGIFIHSCIYRLARLGASMPITQVRACDIDATACQQIHSGTGLPWGQIWNADLMSLVNIDGIHGQRFNAIVGNPPFISVHRMTLGQRASARAAVDRLEYRLDGKASLWSYFVVACTRSLKPGGRLCLILPQAALHAGYAREVMHGISKYFTRSMMVSLREICFSQEGTKERVVILLGDEYHPEAIPGNEAALVECANVAEVKAFLGASNGVRFKAVPKLNGHAVPHLLASSISSVVHLEGIDHSHALSEYIDVKIGAVTGANDFFVISEEQRRRLRLPLSSVIPVLLKFGKMTGLRYSRPMWKQMRDSGARCWLLMPRPKESRATVLKYLESFDASSIQSNRTFAKRPHWFRTTLPRSPDAFLKYMGSSGPRIALSTFDCQCTNSTHAVYFHDSVTPTQRRAILISVHSSFSRLSAEFEGRSYGTDALKLEPSEAKRIRLIMPIRLHAARIKGLFSSVHELLSLGLEDAATSMVDDWLYTEVPSLSAQLPKTQIGCLLAQARNRRRVYVD